MADVRYGKSFSWQHKWLPAWASKGDRNVNKDIHRNIESVSSDKGALCFDGDESNRDAIDECTYPFKSAIFPSNDASGALFHGEENRLVSAQWEAKSRCPDRVFTLEQTAISLNRKPSPALFFGVFC
jgi:hypothetical protein